jgi:hypothetical protein
VSDIVDDLINDHEFIVTLARFADGLTTQAAIKKRYKFTDDVWEQLGSNEALVEKIEAEKARRIRRGDTAREKAQRLYVQVPDVLGTIMNDPSSSARHRIESAKELRVVADNGPETAPPASTEKFQIVINLGADVPPLVFNKSIAVGPHGDIDTAPQELLLANKREDDSNTSGYNTAKGVVEDTDPLPTPWGLIAANKQGNDGNGGQPL